MDALQSLKNMCERCERNKVSHNQQCPFRSISGDYCEDYETIKKAIDIHNLSNNELLKLIRSIKEELCLRNEQEEM